MDVKKEVLIDLFVGSALGTFAGDAFGMPFEGWPPHAVRAKLDQCGSMQDGRFSRGTYTDDTEMMIGILEGIATKVDFDPEVTARNFLNNFHPKRGYGARIYGLMERLREGVPWDQVGTDSFGNGSAMRVAPIGFFFYNDPDRIREAAILSSRITHIHPEGIAGAAAQALAVGFAVSHSLNNRTIEPFSFIETIAKRISPIDSSFALRLRQLKTIESKTRNNLISELTGFYHCNVKAIEAVPPAIGAFLFTNNFKDAVILAVSLGGDTDTIGAMAGAIAGGYYGYKQIPLEWLEVMENEGKGRDYVVKLARRAAALAINKDNKKSR
ncbi:MAG: ADP-ribosylglycohydrolase family protein [Deltaproteobacteria bacterium]|nr:ADP-ribosylglycohydrolase family protein [Deltaproteobacteria bacterium]